MVLCHEIVVVWPVVNSYLLVKVPILRMLALYFCPAISVSAILWHANLGRHFHVRHFQSNPTLLVCMLFICCIAAVVYSRRYCVQQTGRYHRRRMVVTRSLYHTLVPLQLVLLVYSNCCQSCFFHFSLLSTVALMVYSVAICLSSVRNVLWLNGASYSKSYYWQPIGSRI